MEVCDLTDSTLGWVPTSHEPPPPPFHLALAWRLQHIMQVGARDEEAESLLPLLASELCIRAHLDLNP